MRILHVHSGNRYGGVESVLRVMAARRGSASPVESVFALSFDGRLAEELRTAGAEVCVVGEVRAARPFSVLRARSNLSSLLRQRHFDATMVHSAWALSLLAHSRKTPMIFYQHDVFDGHHWTEKFARRIHPDLLLANSAFTAATTALVFPGRQAEVLYPPAALPVKQLPDAERQALRALHNVPAYGVAILIAARFEKWKGHRLLLEALGSLRQNPRWCLWIAGEPQTPSEREYRELLKVAVANLQISDRAQFLGHVSDIPALMQAADIYCQPNTGPEPFGLTFVEALASSLPVVATPLGGVREILEPVWGLLAMPTPSDVAAKIERLLWDPDLRRRLGQLGVARAHALCDPETQLAKLAQSTHLLLADRATNRTGKAA